jgi:hypothetical protein
VLSGYSARTTEDGHARMTMLPQTTMKQATFRSGSLLRPLGAFEEMMWLAEHDGRKEPDAEYHQ